MSLAIACGHSTLVTGLYGIQPHVSTVAAKLYFDLGGLPSLNDNQTMQMSGGPLGVSMASFDVKFSSKHNGLALYFARLLHPIWKKSLVKKQIGKEPKQAMQPGLSVEHLVGVQRNLQSLERFLRQYPKFIAPPTPDSRPSNIDPEAWKAEQQSIANMADLLTLSTEAISFLTIIMDYSLTNIGSKLSEQDDQELRGLTFEAFVSTSKGRELAKSLMAALVNSQLEKDTPVETIITSLQQRCPTICESNDVILFKGIELVQNARSIANQDQQSKNLREALSLFTSVLKTLSFDKLKDIVESFKSLRYYSGIVDLSLTYASYLDPVDPLMAQNDTTAHQSYFKRIDCYKLIFSTLASIDTLQAQNNGRSRIQDDELGRSRKSILDRALASEDHLFHCCLYEWYIEQGLTESLLELRSPFLEQYLQQEKGNFNKAELLWKFYVRNGRFAESAQILSEIAHAPGLNLVQRLEYLTKAVTNAKSSSGADLGLTQQLLNELVDSLDVAKIQHEILTLIAGIPGREEDVAELNDSLLDISSVPFTHLVI